MPNGREKDFRRSRVSSWSRKNNTCTRLMRRLLRGHHHHSALRDRLTNPRAQSSFGSQFSGSLLTLEIPSVDAISLHRERPYRRTTVRKDTFAMKRSRVVGTMLATAVALAFMKAAASAADAPSPSAQPGQIKCLGANSCKGQSACKTVNNSCKGQNSCKGRGYIITADAKSCKEAGGHVGKKRPMAM